MGKCSSLSARKTQVNYQKTFRVYTYDDFNKLGEEDTITIYGADSSWWLRFKNLFHSDAGREYAPEALKGTLKKTATQEYVMEEDTVPSGHAGPTIARIEVATGYTLGGYWFGGSQYLTVHFSDGSQVWYKQPDRAWRGLARDQPYLWIRGRLGMNGFAPFGGQKFVGEKFLYPEEFEITRMRRKDDPTKDVSYINRAKWLSRGAFAVGTVVAVVAAAEVGAAAVYYSAGQGAVSACGAGAAGGVAGTAGVTAPGLTALVPVTGGAASGAMTGARAVVSVFSDAVMVIPRGIMSAVGTVFPQTTAATTAAVTTAAEQAAAAATRVAVERPVAGVLQYVMDTIAPYVYNFCLPSGRMAVVTIVRAPVPVL